MFSMVILWSVRKGTPARSYSRPSGQSCVDGRLDSRRDAVATTIETVVETAVPMVSRLCDDGKGTLPIYPKIVLFLIRKVSDLRLLSYGTILTVVFRVPKQLMRCCVQLVRNALC